MASTRQGGVDADRYNQLAKRGLARAFVLEPECRRLNARILTSAGRQAADRLRAWGETATVTAAAQWAKPEADVLMNLGELADALSDANRRMRERIIRASMGDLAVDLGVNFDLKNPVVDGVLRTAGQQIRHVSESQRQTIMDALDYAWQDGMSIDQAAKLVAQRSDAVALTRARVIARTEIVGIANGGSLAATKISGSMSRKEWLTASGAKSPRHHTYYGLDGQLRGLNEKFSVGGAALAYPGDPSGPPSEVIHCRCSIAYRE